MSRQVKALPRVRSGEHFISGNLAIAEGCIAGGCSYFGGYPITPSSEIAEHCARRLPQVGGVFIQMEDELGAIASVLGASWAGQKSMTATSGPGYSLMVENIGLGVMMETPAVIINVQRGGPSTGLPTQMGQQDMYQAKYGSHGDYEVIALSPNSVQESFELAIECFNLAEKYRVPVTMLTDENIGHMTEKLTIPSEFDINIEDRVKPTSPNGFKMYEVNESLVSPMPAAGEGYKIYTTGLTHDERGYPDITAEAHEVLVRRLIDKITKNAKEICRTEDFMMDDAEIMVVSYGITARIAKGAVKRARKAGIKAGLLRLITIWPFPDHILEGYVDQLKGAVVAEVNNGQIRNEVRRVVRTGIPIPGVGLLGGKSLTVDEILKKIKEIAK